MWPRNDGSSTSSTPPSATSAASRTGRRSGRPSPPAASRRRSARRHLQQDLQLLADRDGAHVVERLGAVARLEQERSARRDLRERVLRACAPRRRRRAAAAPAARRSAASSRSSSGQAGWWPGGNAAPGRRRPGASSPSTLQCRRRSLGHSTSAMRIFSRHPADGRKHARQLRRRLPPVRGARRTQADEAFFCIVDLHSITVDYEPEELRESTLDLARAPDRLRPRSRPLDGLRAEPRARRTPRRRGCSARDELRRAAAG